MKKYKKPVHKNSDRNSFGKGLKMLECLRII